MTRSGNIAPVPWAWYLFGLALALASSLFGLSYFGNVPDPMPTHFNASGEADAFTPKSVESFLTTLLFGPVVISVVGIGSAALISAQARAVESPRGKELLSRTQKPLAGFLIALILIISLDIHQAYGAFGTWNLSVWWVLVAIGGLTAWLLYSISRIVGEVDQIHPPEDDTERLKWGLFYFNRSDKRVMVDQMGGANTTLNFARPQAWAVLIALLAPAFIVAILVIVAG